MENTARAEEVHVAKRMNSQAGGFSPVLWNDGLATTR